MLKGAIGPRGERGREGAPGPQGLRGNDGALGPQGPLVSYFVDFRSGYCRG